MLLIITSEFDITSDWVVRELRQRGERFLRLNTERLPDWQFTWTSKADDWLLTAPSGHTFPLSDVRGVLYRRPVRPFGAGVAPETAEDVLNRQWGALLDAICLYPGPRWINNPFANYAAECKVNQLREAIRSGLEIPRTVVSNDINAVSEFVSSRSCVVKALDAPVVVLEGEERFMFTSKVTPDDLTESEAISTSPLIYQELVDPRVDVRVTVVGERAFASAAVGVKSQDWRLDADQVRFEPTVISASLTQQCVTLVRALGLTFGGIDLLQHGDQFTFLEINPSGEWGWLQASGVDIAGAIADELVA